MSVEENKVLVEHFFEAVNKVNGDLFKMQAWIGEFIAPEHIAHSPQGDTKLEQSSQMWGMIFSAFPDLNEKIVDIVAEGDKVVVRLDVTGTHKGHFNGMPPLGNKVHFGEVSIMKVANGKILEEWDFPDMLSLMQQIGTVPSNQPNK
jgi:predicted ester cyclase